MRPASQEERKKELEAKNLENVKMERRNFLKRVSDGKFFTWNPYLAKRKAEFVVVAKNIAYNEIAEKEKLDEAKAKKFFDAPVVVEPVDDDFEDDDNVDSLSEGDVEVDNGSESLGDEKPIPPPLNPIKKDESGMPLNKMSRPALINYIKENGGDVSNLKNKKRDALFEIAKEY